MSKWKAIRLFFLSVDLLTLAANQKSTKRIAFELLWKQANTQWSGWIHHGNVKDAHYTHMLSSLTQNAHKTENLLWFVCTRETFLTRSNFQQELAQRGAHRTTHFSRFACFAQTKTREQTFFHGRRRMAIKEKDWMYGAICRSITSMLLIVVGTAAAATAATVMEYCVHSRQNVCSSLTRCKDNHRQYNNKLRRNTP